MRLSVAQSSSFAQHFSKILVLLMMMFLTAGRQECYFLKSKYCQFIQNYAKLESILPEIIFFQWSQQSFWPIFPPIFLNLMFIYLFIFFSCVISKGKKHILKDSFLRQCSIRDFKQIVPINSNFLAPIWAKYFVRTPKNIKSLAKQTLVLYF